MPTEVRSPINRKSDDVTLSPGARSHPSARRDSVPEQPRHATHTEPEPRQQEADARRASKKPCTSTDPAYRT